MGPVQEGQPQGTTGSAVHSSATGMAASDPHQRSDPAATGDGDTYALGSLGERLGEEIARAERHGTGLSCLLVAFDDLDRMAGGHPDELREQTLEYVVGALRSELRCFDRVGRTAEGDVLLLLPGADSPRAEVVARRALERLRTIKVESAGTRTPLQVSVGLAAWRDGLGAQALVLQAHAALRSIGAEHAHDPALAPAPPSTSAEPPAQGAPPASARERTDPATTLGCMGGQ